MARDKGIEKKLNTTMYKTWNADAMDLGIYIHIPFCAKKCDYCDFLSGPSTTEERKAYFDALIQEIKQYRGKVASYLVRTIFIGGGTPSVVDSSYIIKIMECIKEVFQIDEQGLEATIEINPGTVNKEKLLDYKKAGINRISFGLQSAKDEELKLLGRIHSYQQFVENYNLARELGFHNINIDLMSALPGQTLMSWEETLHNVIGLNPEHISAYSLIIEEGTKFYERYQEGSEGSKCLPDEETDRLIYHSTKKILKNNGYDRYEISNYSREGFACRHNLSYWIGTEYLGFGLGASSYFNGARFSNVDELGSYIDIMDKIDQHGKEDSMEELRKDYRPLTNEERMEEFMFLGLRVSSGISIEEFTKRFSIPINEIYGKVLDELAQKKLVHVEGDLIKLTEYGVDISNYVLAEFLLD